MSRLPRQGEVLRVTGAIILWVAVLIGCTSGERTRPDAVFLIVVDTLRPDRLSCYGYAAHDTPNIDRLAASGVLFENAFATASWTGPSIGSIMTSKYPTQLGMVEEPVEQTTFRDRERRRQIRAAPPPEALMLAETMGTAGFHTAAFVNQAFLNAQERFFQGFDEWCYTTGEEEVAWRQPGESAPYLSLSRNTDLGLADAALVSAFVDWLGQEREGRTFVWLHLLRPHWPYAPPAGHMSGHPEHWPETADSTTRYDGEIRATDEDVGRALAAIEDRYGLENVLVIFTSDHGEAFGEHGGFEHGHSLHGEITRVPMIATGAGLPAGRRVRSVARTIDVAPTVLEVALRADESDQYMGESLIRLIDNDRSDRPVYAAGMLYEGTERSWIRDGYRILNEIDGYDRYSLYDLRSDPLEEKDLSKTRPTLLDSMRREMDALDAAFRAEFSASVNPGTELNPDEEDERTLRALRALGYVK